VSAASPFEFASAGRILFGSGVLAKVPALVRELGIERVFLLTGRTPERARTVRMALEGAGIAVASFAVAGEPTVPMVRSALEQARASRCDGVVAFGGGSAIDAGKAVAALLANGGDPMDYIEVVGRGQVLKARSVPTLAIPTTAGTGSEVTKNAVLGVPEFGIKASMRSVGMLPTVAVVDPDLLQGTAPEVIAACGLDALSQLIEPFVSIAAHPMTDALARTGIVASARALERVYSGQGTAALRDDLALASVLGGLCLANAGLGAVHGFAAPIGGMFDAPHGAVCAALLPAVMETNHAALQARAPSDPRLQRFAEVAAMLTGNDDASAADGVAWVSALCGRLSLPGLARYGVTSAQLGELVSRGKNASSMKKNPIVLTDAELHAILERSL